MRSSLILLLAILLVAVIEPIQARPAQVRGGASEKLAARWVGQDGKDFVGPSSETKPSGIQDVHIQLVGLPPRGQIDRIVVKGHGGDEWQFNSPTNVYRAHLVRTDGSTRADLYIEPTRIETGRTFEIKITLTDGRSTDIYFEGGKADPALRMAAAKLRLRWIGQDGRDRVGATAAVGPDGFADVVLALDQLAPSVEIRSISVASGKTRWEAGLNPEAFPSAEWLRDTEKPAQAALFVAALDLRAGATIHVRVTYANGTTDIATTQAGKLDPGYAVSKPMLASISAIRLESRLVGQDGADSATPGVVRMAIAGLTKPVIAAALSNRAGDCWVGKSRDDAAIEGAFYTSPLRWEPGPDGRSATLSFAPTRNEQGSTLMLRMMHPDGSQSFARLPGPRCDPSLRSPRPDATKRTVRPGEELAAIAGQGGAIHLASGTHGLSQPLILERPTTITADPDTTIRFTQPAGSPAWTTAIKIHAGNTSLEGFAIRFSGPVRWDFEVGHGPALIGTTDDRDPPHTADPRAGVVLRRLDMETPPPSTPWERTPNAMRLISAACGTIEENRIRGGAIELTGGPWIVRGNRHLGTPEGMFTDSIISARFARDLVVEENEAAPDGPAGKTWRFLVLTQRGAGVSVRDNRISDIGPRANDTIADANAPEIILTESYRLRFEGAPLAVSAQGMVLTIPEPQGELGDAGDVVAILAGPHSGQYRRVAQRIDRQTYLLDEPLPALDAASFPALSISAGGFVDAAFEKNTIEGGAESKATGFVLAGHHYGTRVAENVVRHCAEPFTITAFPTEQPVFWGWSHAPMFGLVIEGNTSTGSSRPPRVGVERGEAIKTSAGRLYFQGSLKDNQSDLPWSQGEGGEPGQIRIESGT